MEDCIFCKIVTGEIPSHKVYEDDKVLAFLDIEPVNPGHTLVIPKEHHSTLSDLPDELLCHLVKVIKKITPAIIRAVKTNGFNLGLNNGQTAGQIVPHFHWHIMPRFENDGYALWSGQKYEKGQAEEVLEKIKEKL